MMQRLRVPPGGCVTLGKSLHCSEPQVSRLSSEAGMCLRDGRYGLRDGQEVMSGRWSVTTASAHGRDHC